MLSAEPAAIVGGQGWVKTNMKRRRGRLMNADELEEFINRLLSLGRAEEFYWCYDWKVTSAAVIKRNRYECLRCKRLGRVGTAKQVHHRFPKSQYPRWALSEFVTLDDGTVERNLEPLCARCHEEVEAERQDRKKEKEQGFKNDERW